MKNADLMEKGLLPLFLSGIVALYGWGCAECKIDSDCKNNEICRHKKCVADDTVDTGSDSGGDISDTATNTGAPPGSDPKSDTDSGTADGGDDQGTETLDTETTDTADRDTDDTVCTPTLLQGSPCDHNCECFSNHCGDGFCCDEGECCGDADDCDDTRCVQYFCSGNKQCMYSEAVFGCGSQDTEGGDTCVGAQRCDGFGGCVEVTVPDCGPYAPSDVYTCEEGAVEAGCHTNCTIQNGATNCAEGATCVSSTCRMAAGLNGEACSENGECASGHCGDGICCGEGECCRSAADCDDSVCNEHTCTDNECRYNPSSYWCGAEDPDGCGGEALCNGLGECLSTNRCAGPYAGTGAFVCAEDEVRETCYTSCGNATQCADDYRCEAEECVPGTLENGAACSADAECISGHCGDGYCCSAGECCAADSDCDDTLCNARRCDENSRCDYSAVTDCGFVDNDLGERCTGDDRCDGFGNCASVSPCSGAYASDGGFACSLNEVSQRCNPDCANLTDCNDGYFCEGGACVSMGRLPNGAACAGNGECDSNHCEGGICCTAGECCTTPADCDDSLCVQRSCGNFSCVYHDIGTCGAADTLDGDLCAGESLCDGQGGCAVVDRCDAFAPTGEYACAAGTVSEVCFTTCSDDSQCNEGDTCTGGTCADKLSDGQGPCDEGRECESGYCTPSTGICCSGGLCCHDDDDCDGYLCDTASWSCAISCTGDSGDDDTRCEGLGDFHCDSGTCFADLPNGGAPCDENTDCLSGYCDLSSGTCCDAGACCSGVDDCDGFACSATFHCENDCSPSSVEDDALCGEGFHCVGDLCEADIADGRGTCEEDTDCAGGNCNTLNGICCSQGDGACCSSPSHCEDGNPCTRDRCGVDFHCYFVPSNEGESCSDGRFCNGPERCDNTGGCAATSAPCADTPAASCTEVTCFDCAETVCDEENDTCVDTAINDGEACTDPEFCIGDISRVCQNSLCVDPGTGVSPCTDDTGNPCTVSTCNETTDSCTVDVMVDGWDCDDGDPCNGENQCMDGVCVAGESPPCDDGDPCTTDPCTPNGDEAACGVHEGIPDGAPCNEGFACFGTAPTCYQGVCIPDDDQPCNDDLGICTIHECQEVYYNDYDCGIPIYEDPYEIPCVIGTTPIEDIDLFSHREYDTYNATCPGTFDGPEAVVVLEPSANGTATISVSHVDPAMDIEILLLDNWCDPTSCTAHGTNSLTTSVSEDGAVFVLEASVPLPPEALDIVVGACPQ